MNDTENIEKKNIVIFFIHGMFSSGVDVFGSWKEYFDTHGCRSRILDCRQHTIKLRINSVEHAIESLPKSTQCILIGHSLGGFIAQKALNKYPDRVRGAVLLMSAALDDVGNMSSSLFMRLMRFRYLRDIFFSKTIPLRRDDLENLLLSNVPDGKKDTYLNKLRPVPSRVAWESLFLTLLHGIKEKDFQQPMLVIGGTKDNMLPIHIQKKVAEKYSADFWETDFGHMPMWEEGSEQLIAEIKKWMHNLCVKNS